jgi:hypothetical protein
MLWWDVVPSRYLRHHSARLIGFRHYLALGRVAPSTPASDTGTDIDAAAPLRSVNYMLNHICEPIPKWPLTSADSAPPLQDGDKTPLTVQRRVQEFML